MAFRRAPEFGESKALTGETRNISTGGMCFTTPETLALNEILDFALTFPALAHRVDVRVVGRARVLRVVRAGESGSHVTSVAVATEEYHVLEPEANNP